MKPASWAQHYATWQHHNLQYFMNIQHYQTVILDVFPNTGDKMSIRKANDEITTQESDLEHYRELSSYHRFNGRLTQ